MSRDPNALLLLIASPVIVVELIAIVRRFPTFGMWVFMAASVLSTYSWPRGVTFLGYQVYALDIVSAALLGAVVFRVTGRRHASRSLWLLLGLFTIALIRGIAEFGSQTAVNNSRELLYVLIAILFAQLCLGVDAWPKLEQLWMATAAVLVVIALVHFARFGFGTYSATGKRALIASQALVVAQAGLISLTIPGRRQRLFAVVCFMVVVASDQRTVWAATLTAGLVLAFGHRAVEGTRVSSTVRRGMLAALVSVVLLLALGPTQLQQGASTATSTISTDSSSTLGWRLDGWRVLLQQYAHKPGLDQVLGEPFGAGFTRSVGGNITIVAPHNMYIDVLFLLGAVGLVGLLLLLTAAFRRASRVGVALRAQLAGLAVFAIGYQFTPEQGFILGAALALALPASPVSFGASIDDPPRHHRVARTTYHPSPDQSVRHH